MRIKIDQKPAFTLLLDDGRLKIVSYYRLNCDSTGVMLGDEPLIDFATLKSPVDATASSPEMRAV